MDASPLRGKNTRRHRWELLLLLLAVLLSFACVLIATWLAISRPPERLSSPALAASGQADYRDLPDEGQRFGPLHSSVGAEAALDAAWLQVTVTASGEGDPNVLAILSLPPTPTASPTATPAAAAIAMLPANPATPVPESTILLSPSASLPTNTPSPTLARPTSTLPPTPQPTATATSVASPTPTATPFNPPSPTATTGFVPPPTEEPPSPPTETPTFTPVPPTPTDTATATPTDTPVPTPTDTPAPANAAPIALDDVALTSEDTPVSIPVVANDTDPDLNLDVSSVTTVTSPFSGTLNIATSGDITYASYADLNGIDVFTYQVCDTGLPVLCDTATVTVTITPINDPPQAHDDATYITFGTSVVIDVIANDVDVDGNLDPTSVTTTTNPLSGTLSVDPAGLITYTPALSYTGTDSFSYQICDSGAPVLCDTASVSIAMNNLAQGKPTQESSSHNSNQTGEKAVDGNIDTFWRTAIDSSLPSEWIVVDLGTSTSISQAVLRWGNSYATSYTILVSPDGLTWTPVFSTTTGDGGVDSITFSPTTARYVKLDSTAWSGGSWRIWLNEFEIFQ